MAINYFEHLYTSTPALATNLDDVFQGYTSKITAAINVDLTRPVTEQEIEDSAFAVGPTRAPGPDGFSGDFYQQYWQDIKGSVIAEVNRFFEENFLDERHNHTNLCLIPKVAAPLTMGDFRPIALCNVSYKIISKILVNRLKRHLGGVITDNQAAFVPGRMITDNIIMAHEVYYALKARKRQATSYMAIKTDITKAYDRLEWAFLEETMRRMGFEEQWISWIMKCVTSVSYSILINGTSQGHFKPGRGIRQGDPLSPYLFILCAEVLSHMMHQAEATQQLKGIKICSRGPALSHLLFADDSLFFTLANQRSAKAIQSILKRYEEVSGQAVNLRKSAITFGRLVRPDTKRQMRHLLGIHNEGGGGKYLGLPEQFDKKKSELFRYIVEKVKEKTQGWSKKYLSQGGKEVLLKAVALAMPVYSMNVFKLTKGICEEINGILAKFWWGSGNEQKGMHWFSWDRLSLPKREGGLGFKELESFNVALLGKQTWRLLERPHCLMARMLKGRYFPDTNIMHATQGQKASFIWKSILQGRDLVKKGLRYCVGNGTQVNAWFDHWLPVHPPRPPQKTNEAPTTVMVSELLNSTHSDWDHTKLDAWIVQEDVEIVKNIKVCASADEDLVGWHYTKSGIYTVRSAYWLAQHTSDMNPPCPPPGNPELKQMIWKLKTAPKIQHFCWRMLSGALTTGETLRYRHITSDAMCKRCCQEDETTIHLFFNCDYARAVWRGASIPNPLVTDPTATLEAKLRAIFSFNSSPTIYLRQLSLWILWRIWKSRNTLNYQRKHISWQTTLRLAKQDATEWQDTGDILQTTTNNNSTRPGSRQGTRSWRKPLQGWIKCNYDGSSSRDNPSKAGWVIRDDTGQFIGAGQAEGRLTTTSLECEIQALVISMQHCWSRGYKNICFEGDNQELDSILNGRSPHFGVFNWLREVLAWKKRFQGCKFLWTGRKNNTPADILAKQRLPQGTSFIFHHYIPFVIRNSLLLDCTLSSN